MSFYWFNKGQIKWMFLCGFYLIVLWITKHLSMSQWVSISSDNSLNSILWNPKMYFYLTGLWSSALMKQLIMWSFCRQNENLNEEILRKWVCTQKCPMGLELDLDLCIYKDMMSSCSISHKRCRNHCCYNVLHGI